MTPIERFARWFALERGMRCDECNGKVSVRWARFCSTAHETEYRHRTAW